MSILFNFYISTESSGFSDTPNSNIHMNYENAKKNPIMRKYILFLRPVSISCTNSSTQTGTQTLQKISCSVKKFSHHR